MVKRYLAVLLLVGCLFWPFYAVAQSENTAATRLQAAVVANNVVLDDTQKASLAGSCRKAQTYLAEIQDDTNSLIEKRDTAYSSIQKELQAIKLRMIKQGADASETDLLTGKIQQALDVFDTQAAGYKVALSDVIRVDCVAQPEYFKAGLIVMRVKRAYLLDASIQLKAVVTEADSNIFTQLKRRLTL